MYFITDASLDQFQLVILPSILIEDFFVAMNYLESVSAGLDVE
jgi:hypothetical protein